jgi:CRISPR/Cas system Type II protein with McrA/HNH and RuvC-like nuclease domain
MKLINYKWTQLLERYNVAPNIAKKIKASSELKIKRSTNEKQKNLLIEFFDNTIIRDFFTGEAIEEEFIEIDHVIPWTFLYSDEIWNMVLVSTKKTQSRNQKAPTKTEIEKLKRRNVVLCEKLQSTNRKEKRDMEFAIENKLVDKFFVDVQ